MERIEMAAETQTLIEDVLDDMLLNHDAPTVGVVRMYCDRYPRHSADLLEFAAGWAEELHLPAPETALGRERRVAKRATEGFRQAVSARPSMSLADLAAAAGRSLEDVARVLEIPVGVVTRVNARRIEPNSIGKGMVSRLSDMLRIDGRSVIAAWSSAPAPLAAAAFLPRIGVPRQTLRQALVEAGSDPALIDELAK